MLEPETSTPFIASPDTPVVSTSTPPIIRWIGIATVGLVVFVISVIAYFAHERSVENRLSAENSQLTALLKETRSQIDTLSARLDAMTPVQLAPEKSKPSATHQPSSRPAIAHRRAGEGSQLKKFQAQLDSQGRAIQSTQQDLVNTRTELQGSIAKTHEEIVVLQKKGQRNYYEFDLDKSKQFQHTGPVGLSLRKANTKHQYADLELMVEDTQLSKKHVNLYEPVRFYPGEDQQSVELVINSIRKNHIHGYISMPKYSSKELVAMDNTGSDNSNVGTNNAPKSRTRLQLPQ